jgi:hypothetical protein
MGKSYTARFQDEPWNVSNREIVILRKTNWLTYQWDATGKLVIDTCECINWHVNFWQEHKGNLWGMYSQMLQEQLDINIKRAHATYLKSNAK